MLSRLAVFSVIAGLAVACTTQGSDDTAASSSAQDLRLLDTTVLGSIQPGTTKSGCSYAPPNRAAWAFTAHAGDVITIGVSSHIGDAVAYLTDARWGVLAYNDDADSTTHDARIVYQAVASGTYAIVFEDYNHLPASFDVSLDIASGNVCNYGGNTYAEGDTFPATDGCNTCTCTNGNAACGTNACHCAPGSDGLDYYGDVAWCKQTSYRCPSGQVRFNNDCGCGCEILTTTHRPRSSPQSSDE